jgi:hypothetical protein
MPINQETLNRRLYKVLHNRFKDTKALDSEGDVSPIEDEADVFRFTFTKDGEEYGKVYVTVDNSKTLKIYYDDDVTNSPSSITPGSQYNDTWDGFTEFMKRWAMKNQLGWEPTDKDHLEGDMARRNHVKKQENMMEGYYPMGKKASYSDAVPSVKMVIQHTREIQEGEQRYRNVAKIFLENAEGERILAPTTKPGIARVYARHIAEGGLPHDERWNHIKGLCEEYQKMAGFVRATRGKQFNESAQGLIESGINHYNSLRESLSKMAGHRGYNMYFESWTPPLMEDDSDTSSINELFVQETMDPRIESVMPILSKLHKTVAEMKEVDALAEWADSLLEAPGAETLKHNQDTEEDNLKAFGLAEDELDEATDAYSIPEEKDGPIEAHGVHGMKSKPWRKTFKNQAAFEAWLEKNEGNVEVHGTREVEQEVEEGKTGPGLWANIHAKQERIKHGSGEKMRKPGSKGAPTAQNFKDAAKEDIEEDLGPEQKRVGQLGPTEKVKNNNIGKLVGANESVESTLKALDMLSENFINTDAQAVVTETGRVDSPVSQAITRRILNQHHGLLAKYGPEAIMRAIDEVADWVDLGPDDEIGSSDVSGWVQQVIRYVQSGAGEGLKFNESADYGDLENEYYYVIDTQTGEVVDGPFDNVGEVPLRLMGFDGGHKVKKGAELKGLSEAKSDDPDYDKALKRFKKGLPPKKVSEDQEEDDGRPEHLKNVKKPSWDKDEGEWSKKMKKQTKDAEDEKKEVKEGQEDLNAILRIIKK